MQARAGDGSNDSPLTAEHTVKRLDFENIRVVSSTHTISATRAQALQIHRDLERCKDAVPDPIELIESLKGPAAEHGNVDTSKLLEKYLLMKKEFLQVEAENLFLESYLKQEGEPDPYNVTESELHALEKQLADLRSMSGKETEEIKTLIGAFTAEMESFPCLLDSALDSFDEWDKKMQLMEASEAVEDHMDEASPLNGETNADLERQARELAFLTGNVEIEILELDAKILKQEEYYKRIQNLHNTHTRLDLLNKVLSFLSDWWTIVGYKNNVVILAFKSSSSKQKATQNKHMKPVKEVEYKLHVKVHPKTLAVDKAQFESKSEVPIDDILKEMIFRRMMHSLEVSAEPHNDLEFLLRRVGQRIASSRKPGA